MHSKNINFSLTVCASARWVKPAWPAESVFPIPTFLMGAQRETPEEPARLYYEAMIFNLYAAAHQCVVKYLWVCSGNFEYI